MTDSPRVQPSRVPEGVQPSRVPEGVAAAPEGAWQQNQLALQKHLAAESLDHFLQWSTVQKTMFVGNGAAYIEPEFLELP